MPNLKSAQKRVLVSDKKRLENKMIRSQMNTAIKKFNAAISANDLDKATALLPETSAKIDGAATKGVIHKNNANRKKSQIATALYKLRMGVIVIKADPKTLKQTEQRAAAQRKAAESQQIRETRNAARAEKEAAKAPATKKAPAKATAKSAAAKPAAAKKAPAKKPAAPKE